MMGNSVTFPQITEDAQFLGCTKNFICMKGECELMIYQIESQVDFRYVSAK